MHLRPLSLISAALLLVMASCQSQPPAIPTSQALGDSTSAVATTTLVVHMPNEQPSKTWEVKSKVDDQMTVKALMDAVKGAEFQFTDTLYPGMGHLVTSILGHKNAAGDGAYWQFCIDNVASDRGVDEKLVAASHQVDWHYAKYGELPCKKIGE